MLTIHEYTAISIQKDRQQRFQAAAAKNRLIKRLRRRKKNAGTR